MAGITDAGFVRKLEEECIADIVAEARAVVDPLFDDSPDSVTGQLVGIVGSKWAESYEILEAVYGALSDQGSGVSLDRIAALSGSTRLEDETDAAFRLRRLTELPAAGATTEAGMRAALSKLPGMLAARAVSNRTMLADTSMTPNRPAKSVEAIVLGTADEASILATIWSKLPAGIQAFGTTTTTIADEEGNTQSIGYSPASSADYWIRISTEVNEAGFAGTSILKERIRAFSAGEFNFTLVDGTYIPGGVDLGATMYRSRFSAVASTVAGAVGVTRVEFSTNGTTWQDIDLPLPARGYLGRVVSGEIVRGFDVEKILVVPT